MNNIWLYWETPIGRTEPEYIKLCREIIIKKCKNFKVNLVTPDNLKDFLPDLRFDINKIYREERCGLENNIPIKTAYLRTKLLKEYGGLWLDSDIILLDSLDFILEGLQKHELIAVHKKSGGHSYFSNGFLASIKGGKIISKYLEEQEKRLNKSYALNWGEIGARMLTPVARSFSEDSYYLIEEKLVHPIPYQDYKVFFKEGVNMEKFVNNNTYAFMLFNNLFPKDFKCWTKEEISSSDLLISKIFNKALEGI